MKILFYLLIGIVVLLYATCNNSKNEKNQEAEKTEIKTVEEKPKQEGINQGETEKKASQKKDTYKKPQKFPEDAIKEMENVIQEGEARLSAALLDKLLTISKEFSGQQELSKEELNQKLIEKGFDGIEGYTKSFMAAMAGIDAIKSLSAMQAIIDASSQEKKAAENITLDEAMVSLTQQTLQAGKFTKKDLHFIYDHWQDFVDFKKAVEKNSKKEE